LGLPVVGPLVSAEIVRSRFEIVYVGVDGERRREPLTQGWRVPFEDAPPVRSLPSLKGQAHFPGLRWSASTGRHVGYESVLERDHAMFLDFDPAVEAFSSQPFTLCWHDGRRQRRHTPDFFARLVDGTGVVVDVRPDDRGGERDAEAFAATARACEQVGWGFRRVGMSDAVWVANVRWLAGYRTPRCHRPGVAARLVEVFATPTPLFAGVGEVGAPIAVLPVAYHLLWRHVLVADLRSALLGPTTVVGVGERGGRT
jgi:hypothetical protein